MIKDIKNGRASREALRTGGNELANAVKVTLGAKGRFVVIESPYGFPRATKDGVSVAKEVINGDHHINMGIMLLREAAIRTNEDAGDGTTGSTVIAQAIMNLGLDHVNLGANPMDLKRGIHKAVDLVVEQLRIISKIIPEDDDTLLKHIAMVSANFEEEIGTNILEAMNKVGRKGHIKIEEGNDIKTNVNVVKGMQFKEGLLSPFFITNKFKLEADFDDALVLITDQKIKSTINLIPALELTIDKENKENPRPPIPLLIICADMEGEALSTLIENNNNHVIKVAVVKAPDVAHAKQQSLEDIAIFTGGKVITENLGLTLRNIKPEYFGSVKNIISGRKDTTLLGGGGKQEVIDARVQEISSMLEQSENDFEKDKLEERKARLSDGVAVIEVGAITAVELKEKEDRYIDALSSTKAAIEEGFVPGGGVALIRCIDSLKSIKPVNDDEAIGIQIVREAIEEPLRQILRNAGVNEKIIVPNIKDGCVQSYFDRFRQKIKLQPTYRPDNVQDFGYNVQNDKYEYFYKTGVIDPTKAVVLGLKNAAAVASMMFVTECLIVNKVKPE